MIPYQVIWEPPIWRQSQNMWIRSANKRAFSKARKEIRRALASDPHGNGIALSEGLWKIAVLPLLVCYSIDTPQMQVVISHIYEIP